MSEKMPPVTGEDKVRERVEAHRDWRVMATDYKVFDEGKCVIFYLETKTAKTFMDTEGKKRTTKPMFIEYFKLQRVAREPVSVANQLTQTANQMLMDSMRAVDKK